MPLDESTRRFAFLVQRDLRRIEDKENERRSRGEELRYDGVSRIATWETRRGEVVARAYGERLATYNVRDRIMRWAWAFRDTADGPTHADLVFREGQARGVPQLAMSVVDDVDREEAMTLARLGAVAARAVALHVERRDDEMEIVGLFESARPHDRADAAGSRISVPPPSVEPKAPRGTTPAPIAPYRSLPAIREIYEPRSGARPVDELGRARVVPLANQAVAALARKCPGFSQGLLVATVHEGTETSPKRRLIVQLVAVDGEGVLRAFDPPTDVVEAAAQMMSESRWRKISARIQPKPDGGATLHVDVL